MRTMGGVLPIAHMNSSYTGRLEDLFNGATHCPPCSGTSTFHKSQHACTSDARTRKKSTFAFPLSLRSLHTKHPHNASVVSGFLSPSSRRLHASLSCPFPKPRTTKSFPHPELQARKSQKRISRSNPSPIPITIPTFESALQRSQHDQHAPLPHLQERSVQALVPEKGPHVALRQARLVDPTGLGLYLLCE